MIMLLTSIKENLYFLKRRVSRRSIILQHTTMDEFIEDESLFSDDGLLFGDNSWNCDGCPPPVFDLPPPPRPPWLEDLDDCGSKETLSDLLSQLETCDNTLIRDSHTLFDDTFHSVAVIVVSAIVLVMVLLVAAVMIFQRRKRLHRHSRECHPSNPLVGDPNTFSPQKDLQDPQQFIMGETLNNSTLFHTLAKGRMAPEPDSTLKRIAAVTALTRNGTMTRCCGNLEAHFQRHYSNNSSQSNSLPNHYIPDLHQPAFHAQLPKINDMRQRLPPPNSSLKRTVMELSERPPPMRAPAVLQNNAYPHIIIGGKPFYLIPSSVDENSIHVDGSFESYSYPQHMPIYEEIDGNSSESCGRFYEPSSELEFSSEQGEVGSIERLAFHQTPESLQRSPRLFRSLFTGGIETQQRSLSSHSQNSSQQTNTSEVSSSNSSTTSTSNPNLHLNQHSHYVQLDPELENVMNSQDKKQKIPTSLYENTLSGKSPKLSKSNGLVPSMGLERSRSPQSIYSARLANKSSSSQCSSPNRSVYYYSDTLKRDNNSGKHETTSKQSPIKEGEESFNSDDEEESVVKELNISNSQNPKTVNTVIVLDASKSSDKKKGNATLV